MKDRGIVRLLPVTERARQLFGAEGAAGLADRIVSGILSELRNGQDLVFPRVAAGTGKALLSSIVGRLISLPPLNFGV